MLKLDYHWRGIFHAISCQAFVLRDACLNPKRQLWRLRDFVSCRDVLHDHTFWTFWQVHLFAAVISYVLLGSILNGAGTMV